MINQTHELLPLFEQFISASARGKRTRYAGRRLSSGTIVQYRCIQGLLREYEARQPHPLRIAALYRGNATKIASEKRYWKRFYFTFLDFLYQKKRYRDNYVSSVLKVLRTFFNYLLEDRQLPVGKFHNTFKLPVAPLQPLVLEPSQLKFLIHDLNFERSLSSALRRTKDLFVFGCTVGMRYSDLIRLEQKHLQCTAQGLQLAIHTQKTGTALVIPVPSYLEPIIARYRGRQGKYLLPRLSLTNLNLQVKELCEAAGWTTPLPKIRFRRGKPQECKDHKGQTLRFCDQVTAHTMRRTAITTLLILGVPELVVRRLSGHTPGSKEFYRYVVIAQDYLHRHLTTAYETLGSEVPI